MIYQHIEFGHTRKRKLTRKRRSVWAVSISLARLMMFLELRGEEAVREGGERFKALISSPRNLGRATPPTHQFF